MALTKDQKVELVKEFSSAIDSAESMTFVQFSGLSVDDATALRSALYEDGVSYKVAKKTLLKRALEAASVEGTLPPLEGNVAIAWSSDDATAAARGVHAFAKDHEENLSIIGGIFEGKYMSAEEMREIATIPGIDVLRGMFVNVINSPIQGLAIVLNQIAEKKA
jgi:large subunit ribosomal protein L10